MFTKQKTRMQKISPEGDRVLLRNFEIDARRNIINLVQNVALLIQKQLF